MKNLVAQPPESAQRALIEAALALFGEKGFDGTSTRELAARAGVNISLIAYHFGGKHGLRLACGHEIARRIGAVAGEPAMPGPISPVEALKRLETLVRAIVQFLCTAKEAEDMLSFMLHEVITGGVVLDAIYDDFISPKHSEVVALWARASGRDPASDEVKLGVFALIGQIAYFRLGRHIVVRKMGWQTIGPDEAKTITDLVISNLRAIIRMGGQS